MIYISERDLARAPLCALYLHPLVGLVIVVGQAQVPGIADRLHQESGVIHQARHQGVLWPGPGPSSLCLRHTVLLTREGVFYPMTTEIYQ